VKPTGPGEAEATAGTEEIGGTEEIETAASHDAIGFGEVVGGFGEVVGGFEELVGGFEELVATARPTLLRAAHSATGRHEDAEDAVQSSLLKAMRAWQRVAGQERWRQQAYVRQIVVNTCRSGWRKWGSRVAIGDVPEVGHAPETDNVDDRELLREALARLPERQREVLLLRYYEDLTEAEIAKRLGCAPGTVKSSAARALRSLRDMLPDYAATRTHPANITDGIRLTGVNGVNGVNGVVDEDNEAETGPAATPASPPAVSGSKGPEVLKSA
jgi:RNA polymerase sigma-70 factor (sigma-E family)